MISFGGIPLQVPSVQEAAWIESNITIRDAFAFFRPRWLSDPILNPRPHFNWFLSRPMRINTFFHPWGASRFGYAFVLADSKMWTAITAQNTTGQALPFIIDDGLGNAIMTPLFMLPPVPLSKIFTTPSLPLYLLPLVDLRYFFWERSAVITVTEGTTTWANVFTALASGLGISLTVDTISSDYLKPSVGFHTQYQHLPLLMDLAASSVGQRFVRRLDGNFFTLNPSTAASLVVANANLPAKYAGGSLALGLVEA